MTLGSDDGSGPVDPDPDREIAAEAARSPFAPPPGTAVDSSSGAGGPTVSAVAIGPPTSPTHSPLIDPASAWVPPPSALAKASGLAPGTFSMPAEGGADEAPVLPAPLDWYAMDHGLAQCPPPVVVERRPRWQVVGVVIAAFALLCGTGFAYLNIVATDGSASPEAAVRALFDAIDHEDAIGVLESLPPSERDVLKQPVVDVVGELQRLGVLSPFELARVPGADLTVQNLTLQTEPVGDNQDLQAVSVTGGAIGGRTIPESVPLGDTLRHIITDDFHAHVDLEADSFSQDLGQTHLRLITVKERRGWHVSLFYSVADALRGDHQQAPVLGGGPDPIGATTPEGAVRELANAAVALDMARVITVLSPDELRAAYDYAPLFLPELNKAAGRLRQDVFAMQLARLDTRLEGDGAVRRVFITAFDLTLGDNRTSYHVTFDGSCFKMDETISGRRPRSRSTPTHTEQCVTPGGATTAATLTDGALDSFGLLNGFVATTAVVVVEREGRWYVSPTRTLFDSLVTGLRKMSRDDLERWGRQLSELVDRPSSSGSLHVGPATSSGPRTSSGSGGSSGSTSTDGTGSGSTFPGECYSAGGTYQLPPTASTDRAAYFYDFAVRTCFAEHGVQFGTGNPCYASYHVLMIKDAPEAQWQAADEVVRACIQARFDNPSQSELPPHPLPSAPPAGTSIPRR